VGERSCIVPNYFTSIAPFFTKMDNFRNLDKNLYSEKRLPCIGGGGQDRGWYNGQEFLDLNRGLVVSVYQLTSRDGDTTGELDTWY